MAEQNLVELRMMAAVVVRTVAVAMYLLMAVMSAMLWTVPIEMFVVMAMVVVMDALTAMVAATV